MRKNEWINDENEKNLHDECVQKYDLYVSNFTEGIALNLE